VIAGGMESMSNVPYYLPKARGGLRMGHSQVIDGLIRDGLWDAREDIHMGVAAEKCARDHSISREEQVCLFVCLIDCLFVCLRVN
jgi:acetyl-CoA C-acetyltransferase